MIQDGHRQVPDVERELVAEQQQEHQRHGEGHAEIGAIAEQLSRLLSCDGQGAPGHARRPPLVMMATNVSSIDSGRVTIRASIPAAASTSRARAASRSGSRLCHRT